MASLSDLKRKLREIPAVPGGTVDPNYVYSRTQPDPTAKYIVISSEDQYPAREPTGGKSILRLLDGRIDSDDRFIGTIAFQNHELDGINLTEAASKFQRDLRRTGLVYNIRASTPPVEIQRNLSDARGAGRDRPKVRVNAILFQFKVV